MSYENLLLTFLSRIISQQPNRTIQQLSGHLSGLDDVVLQYLRGCGGLENFIYTNSSNFKVDANKIVTLRFDQRGRKIGYVMHSFKNYGYITDSLKKVDQGIVNNSDALFYKSDIQNISACPQIVPYDEVQYDLLSKENNLTESTIAVNIYVTRPFPGVSIKNEDLKKNNMKNDTLLKFFINYLQDNQDLSVENLTECFKKFDIELASCLQKRGGLHLFFDHYCNKFYKTDLNVIGVRAKVGVGFINRVMTQFGFITDYPNNVCQQETEDDIHFNVNCIKKNGNKKLTVGMIVSYHALPAARSESLANWTATIVVLQGPKKLQPH